MMRNQKKEKTNYYYYYYLEERKNIYMTVGGTFYFYTSGTMLFDLFLLLYIDGKYDIYKTTPKKKLRISSFYYLS